jgi:uncharacterized low-complexity protein
MKSFKSFYEEFTFKVDVEGLPDMFMKGNSPGAVKAHLRKLVKQPSMIKSVDRMTKHDVKKTYRAKSQGKDIDEGSCGEVDYGSDKSVKIMKKMTPGENVNELSFDKMNKYHRDAQRSKDRATNSAVATILRKGDHSKDLQTRNKRMKGMALAKSRTLKKIRGDK